ncbi:ABC transporter permease [Alkalihalobacillus sp. AL-G]|uniref:ABC transporter permease n=1 Tax=Alkalihalobacillus sp. AL-G TaxID=2926399 RepID=UPI00272A7043|nr:ABC transporter permease [Alkalihalobacillus sp. AL-G]WLD94573.1 ABC transporter permease [Alkalihalobacillus sp. AL-G]
MGSRFGRIRQRSYHMIKKVLFYFMLFILIVTLNFWLPRLMPGGPIAYLQGGGDESMMMIMTQEQKERLLAYYDLNVPIYEQFIHFTKGIIHGDLGVSIHFKSPVTEVIYAHGKWTLFLVGVSVLLTILISTILGVVSAWLRGKKRDYFLFTSLLSFGAVPEFVIAILLLLTFSIHFQWFPLGGSLTPFTDYGTGVMGTFHYLKDWFHHAALPIATLTLANLSSIYLLIRNSSLNVLSEPYIFAAEAKGLSRMRILFHHALRNALLPVVTLIGIRIAFLLTGVILVETVFSYPGMGKLLYTAIIARDYPLLHGLFLVFTTAILCMNLLTDLLYPKLDPRIRRKDIKEYA